MSSGVTVFEDQSPQYGRTWRRLQSHCLKTGDRLTKLRIQSPHKLLDVAGTNYRAFYNVGRVTSAFMDSASELNSHSIVYAVLQENFLWDVYTYFETDNWLHQGFHQAYVPELVGTTKPEHLNHGISLNSPGVVLFK